MYCKYCGSQIDDRAVICPHCGVPTTDINKSASQPMNTLAIVGFILSFFFALAGLICSIIARKQCKEKNEAGAGFALAGLIISIVEIAIQVLTVVFIILFWILVISAVLTAPGGL